MIYAEQLQSLGLQHTLLNVSLDKQRNVQEQCNKWALLSAGERDRAATQGQRLTRVTEDHEQTEQTCMTIYIQRNAHTYLHAKFTNRNKRDMDLLIGELTQHTHAIICLQTAVNKTYILALGHELTHSYTTDEKVHKRMRESIFICGRRYAYV